MSQAKVQRIMTQPINLIFRFLQSKARIQVWLYDTPDMRIEGVIVVRGESAGARWGWIGARVACAWWCKNARGCAREGARRRCSRAPARARLRVHPSQP